MLYRRRLRLRDKSQNDTKLRHGDPGAELYQSQLCSRQSPHDTKLRLGDPGAALYWRRLCSRLIFLQHDTRYQRKLCSRLKLQHDTRYQRKSCLRLQLLHHDTKLRSHELCAAFGARCDGVFVARPALSGEDL